MTKEAEVKKAQSIAKPETETPEPMPDVIIDDAVNIAEASPVVEETAVAEETPSKAKEKSQAKKGKVKCALLNVRATASASGKILCTVPEDSVLVLGNKRHDFVQVTTEKGIEGYAMTKFIDTI